MQRHTTTDVRRYGTGAIILHWLLAALLAVQLGLGFGMPEGASGFALYQLHKSIGVLLLLLTLVRIGWRLTHRPPRALEGGLTGVLAKAVHLGFYAIMLLAPLSGWALVSAAPVQVPTVIFGLFALPHLPLAAGAHDAADAAHAALAWVGIGLFSLHLAGALRHHLLVRDDLVQRMAPNGSTIVAGLLGAGVMAAGTAALLAAGGVPTRTGSSAESESAAPAAALARTNAPAAMVEQEDDAAEDSDEPSAAGEEPRPVGGAEADAPPPPVWTIQPGGRLAFSVGDGSGGSIDGSFARWQGAIRFDPERPERAHIAIEIDLASASVGDTTMDGMLKGDEFLAVGAGPTARYRSTSVRKLGNGRYRANGTLDLKGLGKSQEIAFTLSGEGPRRTVQGTATLDRTAFGIGTGASATPLDQRVTITFGFDAVAQ